MANLFDAYFTFNSTGSVNTSANFKAFLDEHGNIIDKSHLEYGVYNKAIEIKFNKLFYLKKHQIGVGDIIDFITEKTKIKDLIIYLTKGNCGCEKRRVLFNKFLKITWFSLKWRNLYAQDFEVLNYISSSKKEKRSIPKIQLLENNIKNNPVERISTEVKPTMKPIETSQIKGCGCRKK